MALTIDQFRERVSDTRVRCQLCKFRGHSLIAHLQNSHQMSAGQYKKLYPDSSLVSKAASEILRRLNRTPLNTDDLGSILQAFEFKQESLERDLVVIGAKFTVDASQAALIPEVDEFFEFDRNIKLIAYAMANSLNIFSEGPTGCGKTEGFIQAHARARRPLKRVNMNGDVTVANFLGMEKATPQKGTYYDYGALPTAMGYPNGSAGPILPGYTLVVDEVDYAPPQIAAVMSSVLERARTLFIPETGETLVAQPGFNVAATANTGGKGDAQGVYTGTEVLNTAFLDRFPIKLKADYLGWEAGMPKEPDKEEEMLQRRFPRVDQKEIAAMVKAANEVRTAFKQGTLSVTMSTRKLVDYFGLNFALRDRKMAIQAVLTNWLSEDDETLVQQILTRCGV